MAENFFVKQWLASSRYQLSLRRVPRARAMPFLNALSRNIYWTIYDRGGRILIAFATGVIVARLLTPEVYGVLSFAGALVGVVSFLNIAAIEPMVVWALVREPAARYEILGSALMLRLLGGVATILTVVAIVPFLDGPPPVVGVIAPIIAAATLFTAMDVGEYWLRQTLASKYGVIARQIALFIGAGARIWAASGPSPLLMLAIITGLESLLVAVGLALSLQHVKAPPWHWRVAWRRCLQLFIGSLPLLLAAAAVGLYVRIGVIILGQLQGSRAVGLFSVATIMAEATHALPLAIMASATPVLLALRLRSERGFLDTFEHWLRGIVWLGIGVCTTLYFGAAMVVSLLFGSRYQGSVEIFEILIWSAIFVFLSVASEVWLTGQNLLRYQLPKTLLAMTFSIMLNLGLVPALGARGAAIATLLSYSVSAFWANALFRKTRPLFILQLKAFLPFARCPSRVG